MLASPDRQHVVAASGLTFVNVRGHATKVYDGTDFIFTLHLIP